MKKLAAVFLLLMGCSTYDTDLLSQGQGPVTNFEGGPNDASGDQGTSTGWDSNRLDSDQAPVDAQGYFDRETIGDSPRDSRIEADSTSHIGIDPVNLRTAGTFAILTKAGISTVPISAITGDIGVSPIASTAITGFALILDPLSGTFSRSAQVVGKVWAADYAVPTPAKMTAAIGDMQLAFSDAASRPAGTTELGAGDISGKTLAPGVYRWSTGLLIATDVTLTGEANDCWIFQIAQSLMLSSGAQVHLTGGALSKNVFWQVSGLVDLGTTSHIEGAIMGMTSVALHTGASVTGRIFAQTASTLESTVVVAP